MREKYFSTIEEFEKETPAKDMIIKALKEIKPDRENPWVFIISAVLALLLAFRIGWIGNAVTISLIVVSFLFNALLPIFAVLFTIYSLLLAFMNEEYIRELASIKERSEDVSFLMEGTSYYESILFLYFIGVGITGALFLYLNCIDSEFGVTAFWVTNKAAKATAYVVDSVLAVVLLTFYFFYVFRIFAEIKSIIYNTIVLFRASVALKLLNIVRKETNDGNNDKH